MNSSTGDPAWGALLAAQLAWHWEVQARPRLAGLTDDEYFFEPVPGSWSVRPAGAPTPATLFGRREPGFESDSISALILHIHREAIHHLAETALLRDLWAHGLRSVRSG